MANLITLYWRDIPAQVIAERGRGRQPAAHVVARGLSPGPGHGRLPPESSQTRKRATRIDDLPAPVRPTMPSFSPPPIVRLQPLRTSGRLSR